MEYRNSNGGLHAIENADGIPVTGYEQDDSIRSAGSVDDYCKRERLASGLRTLKRMENGEMTDEEFRQQMEIIERRAASVVSRRNGKPVATATVNEPAPEKRDDVPDSQRSYT